MKIGYPESNSVYSVRSPGQAWNALTVGAYSDSDLITKSIFLKNNFKPTAGKNMLSSFSTTSIQWDKATPIKPEVLFPGGDTANNGSDYSDCPDLSLLTTGANIPSKPLVNFAGTSAAVAKAAWMAAELENAYPSLWPEIIRGLIVHSAKWTNEMLNQYSRPGSKEDTKTKGRILLLRHCGYGVPSLNRAIHCLENSINLIIQGEIQPFCFNSSKKPSMNEMHFHKIPWPKHELERLGSKQATLRVTLSYYIEPGPGQIGWNDRYRYASHGLRFDVNKPGETFEEFEHRINAASRENTARYSTSASEGWYLGQSNRDVGSIHSDFKTDTAADLSSVEFIAVYPVIGWWRSRHYLGKIDSTTKYSLIVSVETPTTDAKLYTEVLNQIKIPIDAI